MLSGVSGAEISDSQGIGTIQNDDTAVPEIVAHYLGVDIADGDASPSTSEGTDFGTVTHGQDWRHTNVYRTKRGRCGR